MQIRASQSTARTCSPSSRVTPLRARSIRFGGSRRTERDLTCTAAGAGGEDISASTPPILIESLGSTPSVMRPPEPPALVPAAVPAMAAAPPLEAAALEAPPMAILAADLLRIHGGLRPGGPLAMPKVARKVTAKAGETGTSPVTPITDAGASDQNLDTAEPDLKVMLLACAIGAATGFSVVLFNGAIHAIHDQSWGGIALAGREVIRDLQYSEPDTWWVILATPAVGGLAVAGLRYIAGGFNQVVMPEPPVGLPESTSLAVRVREFFRPALRAAAAAVSLGTGASLGPEGPSVDIGKSISQGMSGLLTGRISETRRTALVAAGAAAGVAAGFNAVISGVFFALENVLLKEQQRRLRDLRQGKAPSKGELMNEYEDEETTIVLVLLAAVTAAAVVQAGLGSEPAFQVPTFNLRSPLELPLYFLLGSICGLVGGSFSASCRLAQDFYSHLASRGFPRFLFPALGGLLTGIIALRYPEVTYEGFANVNELMREGAANVITPPGAASFQYGPALLIELVIVKVVTTALCRESGLVGGVFAPSIFLGASLGTGLGRMASTAAEPITQRIFIEGGSLDWAPAALQLSISAPQSYALVGLTAMLGAICRVPLTAIALLFELTRNYTCIVPAIGAVGLSFYISTNVSNRFNTAYDAWKQDMADAAAAAAEAHARAEETVALGSVLTADSEPSAAVLAAAAAQDAARLLMGPGGATPGAAMPSVADALALDMVIEAMRAEDSSLGRYIIVGARDPAGLVLRKLMDSAADMAVVTSAEGAVLGLLGLEDVLAARVVEDTLLAAGLEVPTRAASPGPEEVGGTTNSEVQIGLGP